MTFRKETLAEGVEVYLGDCLEVLPTLGQFDLCLTDPPFNSGREKIANDDLTDEQWRVFCGKLSRVIDAKNILVEVGKNDKEMRGALDANHRYRWAICLNYTNAMRQGAVGYANTGLVYWYGEGKCHQRYMDRIDAPLENTVGLFNHPSPKTTAHYQKLVEMFSPASGMVIDPFMGSGTSGVSAVRLGRKFTGVEIDPGYFEIACHRISEALKQPDMFIAPPKPIEQTSMFSDEAA